MASATCKDDTPKGRLKKETVKEKWKHPPGRRCLELTLRTQLYLHIWNPKMSKQGPDRSSSGRTFSIHSFIHPISTYWSPTWGQLLVLDVGRHQRLWPAPAHQSSAVSGGCCGGKGQGANQPRVRSCGRRRSGVSGSLPGRSDSKRRPEGSIKISQGGKVGEVDQHRTQQVLRPEARSSMTQPGNWK